MMPLHYMRLAHTFVYSLLSAYRRSVTYCRLFLGGSAVFFRKTEITVVCELVRLISQDIEYIRAHGVVIPHPLRMRKALGSIPNLFTSFACVIMCERLYLWMVPLHVTSDHTHMTRIELAIFSV